MVPDFSKFFGKISLSRHDSTEPRLSSGSWGQKLYVHIEERHGCPTLGGPALIFQTFHFWSSIALNSMHLLTIQWVQTNQLVKPVRIIPYPTLGSQPTASPSVCYAPDQFTIFLKFQNRSLATIRGIHEVFLFGRINFSSIKIFAHYLQ